MANNFANLENVGQPRDLLGTVVYQSDINEWDDLIKTEATSPAPPSNVRKFRNEILFIGVAYR